MNLTWLRPWFPKKETRNKKNSGSPVLLRSHTLFWLLTVLRIKAETFCQMPDIYLCFDLLVKLTEMWRLHRVCCCLGSGYFGVKVSCCNTDGELIFFFQLYEGTRKHFISFWTEICRIFCGATIDYLNSSVKCTAGNFFFFKWILEWNLSCPNMSDQPCGWLRWTTHTHKEWWADGIHRVPATSPLSALPPGPIQQQMSLANRWRLCMFKCVWDWRGQRHKVRLSQHGVSATKSSADLTVHRASASSRSTMNELVFVRMYDKAAEPGRRQSTDYLKSVIRGTFREDLYRFVLLISSF